jgi:hypothetical protein
VFDIEQVDGWKKPIKGAVLVGGLKVSSIMKLDDDARKILEGKNFILRLLQLGLILMVTTFS